MVAADDGVPVRGGLGESDQGLVEAGGVRWIEGRDP
jgi:hypothetical protein